jgi:hypothetical protein
MVGIYDVSFSFTINTIEVGSDGLLKIHNGEY